MTSRKTVDMGRRRAAFSRVGRRMKMISGKKASTQERMMYWG